MKFGLRFFFFILVIILLLVGFFLLIFLWRKPLTEGVEKFQEKEAGLNIDCSLKDVEIIVTDGSEVAIKEAFSGDFFSLMKGKIKLEAKENNSDLNQEYNNSNHKFELIPTTINGGRWVLYGSSRVIIDLVSDSEDFKIIIKNNQKERDVLNEKNCVISAIYLILAGICIYWFYEKLEISVED